MHTAELLDALRERLHLPSDYALAPVLGVTRSQVSRWRNGHDTFSEEIALRVADLLGADAGAVLARVSADRARSERARRALSDIARARPLHIMLSALAVGRFTRSQQTTPAARGISLA